MAKRTEICPKWGGGGVQTALLFFCFRLGRKSSQVDAEIRRVFQILLDVLGVLWVFVAFGVLVV